MFRAISHLAQEFIDCFDSNYLFNVFKPVQASSEQLKSYSISFSLQT